MAEVIIDGIGSGYAAKVDNTNRLWVQTEGITVGSLSVSAGSETWIKGGSISVYNMVAGSIVYMPAVSVTAGSESYIKGGSISVYNRVAGSIVDMPIVGISGTYFSDMIGSVRAQSVQATNPWTVSGNVMVSGTVGINNPSAIGSYTGMSNGSMWFGGGVGSVMISGTANVNISAGIGSVYIIDTNADNAIHEIGSPCFKTSYLIASGAWSQTWTIGGAGSRLEIHGWHISTNLPGWVRILISGTANNAYDSGLIANYFLNYASGGVIEKTFVSPIIPAGAESAIGFGTTCAGSTNVTLFGREVK